MVFPAVVQADELVELAGRAVEGEAQVADAACLLFLDEEIHHAVLHVALFESGHAAAADGVQEVVVEIVRLQLLEGVLVHLDGSLRRGVVEVGEFRGDEILVARMAAQGDACGLFRLPHQVGGGGVEVIDPMFDGVVHHLIDGLLVDDPLPVFLNHGPAHAAEAQEGNLVPVDGILAEHHLLRTFLGRGRRGLLGRASHGGGAEGQRPRARYLDKVSSFHTCHFELAEKSIHRYGYAVH